MNHLILNWMDDDDCVVSHLVSHKEATRDRLTRDFEDALSHARTFHPRDWSMEDVIIEMRKKGWTFLDNETVTVRY